MAKVTGNIPVPSHLVPKGTAASRSRAAKASEQHVQEAIKTGKGTSSSVYEASINSRSKPRDSGGMGEQNYEPPTP